MNDTNLTFEQAQDIRKHINTGYVTIKMLSTQYDVSEETIFKVITNKILTQ